MSSYIEDYDVPDEDAVRPQYYPEQMRFGFNSASKGVYKFTPTFTLDQLWQSLADTSGSTTVDTELKTADYGHLQFSVTQLGYQGANRGVSPGAFAAWPHWEIYGVADTSKTGDYESYIFVRVVIVTDGNGNFAEAYLDTNP